MRATLEQTLLAQVNEALNSIRPFLEADGGDVRVLEINKDKIVILELLGSCGSCPMSMMTMKAGIEQAIKSAIPEIRGVEAINVVSADNPHAKLPWQ